MTKFQKDMLERVVRTMVQAALAVVAVHLADPDFDLDSLQAAAVAAVAAALSAGMAMLGKTIGNPDNGSWES